MKSKIVFSALVFSMLLASPIHAALYTYTDTTTKSGFNISYGLNITPVFGETNKYHAIFDISDTSSFPPNWYAGTFQFKFTSSSNIDIYSSSLPTANWNVADYDTNNTVKTIQGGGFLPPNYNTLLESNRAGFYVSGVAEGNPVDVAQGVKVTNGISSIVTYFDFYFNSFNESVFASGIPFQVDYYYTDVPNSNNKIKVNYGRLSIPITVTVPETGTSLLLFTGMISLIAYRRKKRLS